MGFLNLLNFSNVITPATAQQWLASFLSNAATVGLSTTAWQSGGVARTILALLSNMMSGEDALVSIAAQGGFLDFAATGTVTFTGPTGQSVTQYVTPDPSIPAQWPTPGVQPLPGWLDFLADSTFNVQRILAQACTGNLTFANTSGTPSSAYGPLNYHVADTNGFTYSNAASLTIAASTVIGTTITAATNANPIQITTSTAHGLATGAVVFVAGVLGNTAANGFWVANVTGANTFQLNNSIGNGAYTSGGKVYTTQNAQFAADLLPPIGPINTGAGLIAQPVTTLIGVSCSNLGTFVGQNVESNTRVASRCRLKVQSLSPNGPAGAYAFFALSAAQLLTGQILGGVQEASAQTLMSQTVTQATVAVNTTNGIVTATVANAIGAVLGATGLQVTGATNATPIVLTVSSTAALSSGMNCKVSGVQGNTSANGYWTLTVVDGTHISLNGSAGNATYVSGGVVEGGDLGLVDSVIQANCVPDGVTAITQSAIAQNVVLAATVYVPASQAAAAVSAVSSALAAYFAAIPIGGFVSGVPTPNSIPFNEVLGVIEGAASYIRSATLTLNGTTNDVAMAPQNVAVLQYAGGTAATGIIVSTF